MNDRNETHDRYIANDTNDPNDGNETIVLTFCEKYLFDLILQLKCTLIFKTFVSKF